MITVNFNLTYSCLCKIDTYNSSRFLSPLAILWGTLVILLSERDLVSKDNKSTYQVFNYLSLMSIQEIEEIYPLFSTCHLSEIVYILRPVYFTRFVDTIVHTYILWFISSIFLFRGKRLVRKFSKIYCSEFLWELGEFLVIHHTIAPPPKSGQLIVKCKQALYREYILSLNSVNCPYSYPNLKPSELQGLLTKFWETKAWRRRLSQWRKCDFCTNI